MTDTGEYITGGAVVIFASIITWLSGKRKSKAESADLLTDAAVKLVNSYEKRIENLEAEVRELRTEMKDLLKVNAETAKENWALKAEVIKLENILVNKGDMR